MAIFNAVIDNYDPKGKITACRFFDTIEEKRGPSGYLAFEIRRNGHFDFQEVYEKNYASGEPVDKIKIILTEEEIEEIKYFISGKKDARKIFDEYLNVLKQSKEKEEVTVSKVVELPKDKKQKDEVLEGIIKNPNNGLVKLLYYKQSMSETLIGIKVKEDTEPLYICTYTMIDGKRCVDTEMKRKLSIEEIESIKSFIGNDIDAVNIFDEYLSKIASKTI